MKMRVRGYNEHKLKDPYKFWSKLLDTPPKRGTRCIATYTYVSRVDDSTLRFTFDRSDTKGTDPAKEFCLLSKNNVWTITVPVKNLMPSHATRLETLMGVWVNSNKKTFWNYENPVRVYEGHWSKNWPYEPGVQVRRGFVMDKKKYVDKKRTIEAASANVVKQKLEKVRELAPIMARLLEAHGTTTSWTDAKQIRAELFASFDPDNVTAMDAERVFRLGEVGTCRRRAMISPGQWSMNHKSGMLVTTKPPVYEEEPIEDYRRRCIVNGLRKLREHIYSKEGVYQYEPVKK